MFPNFEHLFLSRGDHPKQLNRVSLELEGEFLDDLFCLLIDVGATDVFDWRRPSGFVVVRGGLERLVVVGIFRKAVR